MLNNFKYIFKNPSNFRGVFYLCLFFISTNVNSQAILKFKETKKSFGFAKKGELIKLKFEFTNSGNEPLVIFEYKVGCSCTEVEFSREPVLSGKSDEIVVIFDTKTVYDRQDRVVEIISNAKNKVQKIRFKGVVLNN